MRASVMAKPRMGLTGVLSAGLRARRYRGGAGRAVDGHDTAAVRIDRRDDLGDRDEAERLGGRVGQADEIASAALFLASDDAGFINGTVLTADGGWTAGF